MPGSAAAVVRAGGHVALGGYAILCRAKMHGRALHRLGLLLNERGPGGRRQRARTFGRRGSLRMRVSRARPHGRRRGRRRPSPVPVVRALVVAPRVTEVRARVLVPRVAVVRARVVVRASVIRARLMMVRSAGQRAIIAVAVVRALRVRKSGAHQRENDCCIFHGSGYRK